MLPFIKSKPQVAGVVVKIRKPDNDDAEPKDEDRDDDGLDACAEDLIQAVHSRDVKGVKEALKSAFDILDSNEDEAEPAEEPEQPEEHE